VTGRSASVTVGRPPLRDRWRRVIFATRRVSPAVAPTMLTYAEHMRADGYVSVKQTTIMARRNMSARTVKDHVAAANAAGVLDGCLTGTTGTRRSTGQCSRAPERVSKTSTLGSKMLTLFPRERVSTSRTPVLTANPLPRSPGQHAERRQVRSDDANPSRQCLFSARTVRAADDMPSACPESPTRTTGDHDRERSVSTREH
jgi:hypothetical protein